MFMFAAKNYIDQEESYSLLAVLDAQISFTISLEGFDSKSPQTHQPKLIVCFPHPIEWWVLVFQPRRSCYFLRMMFPPGV